MRKKLFIVTLLFSMLMVSGMAQDYTADINYFEPKDSIDGGMILPLNNGDFSSSEILINISGYNKTGCNWRFEAWDSDGTKLTDEAGSSNTEPCDEVIYNPEFPENTSTWEGAHDYPDYYEINFTIQDENVSNNNNRRDLWIDEVDISNVLPQENEDFYLFNDQYGGLGNVNGYVPSELVVDGFINHNSKLSTNITVAGIPKYTEFDRYYSGDQYNESFTETYTIGEEILSSGTTDITVTARHGFEFGGEFEWYDPKWETVSRTVFILNEDTPYMRFGDNINYNSEDSDPSLSIGSTSTTYGTYKIGADGMNKTVSVDDYSEVCQYVLEVTRVYPSGEEVVYNSGHDDGGDGDCSTGSIQFTSDLENVFSEGITNNEGIYRIETTFTDPDRQPNQIYAGTHYVGLQDDIFMDTTRMDSDVTIAEGETVLFDVDWSFIGTGWLRLYVDGNVEAETFKSSFDETGPVTRTLTEQVSLSEGDHSYHLEFVDENDYTYTSDTENITVETLNESYINLNSPFDGEVFSYPDTEPDTTVSFEYEVGAYQQEYYVNSSIWNSTDRVYTFERYIGPTETDTFIDELNLSEGSYTWRVEATGQNDSTTLSKERSFSVQEISNEFNISFSDLSPNGTIIVEDLDMMGTDEWILDYSAYLNSSHNGVATFYLDDGTDIVSIGSQSFSNGTQYINESITVGEGMLNRDHSWYVEAVSDVNGENKTSEVVEYTLIEEAELEPEPTWFGSMLDWMVSFMAGTFGVDYEMGQYLISLFFSIMVASLIAWATQDGGAFTFSLLTSLSFFTLAGWFPSTYTIVLGLLGAFILSFFSRNMMDWNG